MKQILCSEYNHDIVDPILNYVQLFLKISTVLGLVLDIACIKYRNLANVILYWESIFHLIVLFVPSRTYLERRDIIITIYHVILYLFFFTNQGTQLIFHTFIMAVINYFVIGTVYN